MMQKKHLFHAATNDVISLNGGTQGGDKFSYLEITALQQQNILYKVF